MRLEVRAVGPREARLVQALMMIGGVVVTVAAIALLIFGLMTLPDLIER